MLTFNLCTIRALAVLALSALGGCASPASAPGTPAAGRAHRALHADNKQLFDRLGLERLHVPAAHHRKRLAEESRHQGDAGDSKMYVIKLPPHPYYYAGEHAVPANALGPAARKLPVGFKSNGKPGRVYHWNVPLLRRIADKQARLDDMGESKANHLEKHRGSKHPVTFYVPTKPKKSFHKYFSGNGKPKSFYVMSKSKNPAHYHRLLP